jgi:3-phenylpropionate/trans-cinnamate dioxygenase ferredoxin subunit
MGDFVKVARAADVPSGTMKGFVVGENKVLIVNVGGAYYALEDKCTHMGAKLSTGMLIGNIIMCIAHGAQFDAVTGKPLTLTGKGPVKKYEARVSGEDIEVEL